ncbi:MAG: CHAT domain-containing protein, partial [Acidobacteriota bacterium]
ELDFLVRQLVDHASAAKRGNVTGSVGRTLDFGDRLGARLLGPIASTLDRADTLLVVPDGPLYDMPWNALVRSVTDDPSRPRSYWIESHAIHSVSSASAFAEMVRRRPVDDADRPPIRLAAFGDPSAPEEGVDDMPDPEVRSLAERGFMQWPPLLFSRSETMRIVDLFEKGETRLFLGADATEEALDAIADQVQVLHFATHGYLDEHDALNSALVLSIPEPMSTDRHNGVLQIWEIIGRLQLDADLVVLSACNTASGEPLYGGGLQSLARAFHLAGARSVVATLWPVDDQATFELMVRFHGYRSRGSTTAEALRLAQLELSRGPISLDGSVEERDYSSPYYWAGFVVLGDSR